MATGRESVMNKAAMQQPKSGHRAPAASGGKGPGSERKVDMRGAQEPMHNEGLGGAMRHLASEHPEAYDDLGPHHPKR